MRILPLALVFRDVPDAGARRPGASRLASHARDGARPGRLRALRAHGASAARAIVGPSASPRGRSGDPPESSTRPACRTISPRSTELEAWTDRGGSGYVVDSFWSAWDAFAGASNYQETHRACDRLRQRHRHDRSDRRRASPGSAGGSTASLRRLARGDARPGCRGPDRRPAPRDGGVEDVDDQSDPGGLGRPEARSRGSRVSRASSA